MTDIALRREHRRRVVDERNLLVVVHHELVGGSLEGARPTGSTLNDSEFRINVSIRTASSCSSLYRQSVASSESTACVV